MNTPRLVIDIGIIVKLVKKDWDNLDAKVSWELLISTKSNITQLIAATHATRIIGNCRDFISDIVFTLQVSDFVESTFRKQSIS